MPLPSKLLRAIGLSTGSEEGDADNLYFDSHGLRSEVRGENTDTDDALSLWVFGRTAATKVLNVRKDGLVQSNGLSLGALAASTNVTLGAAAAAGTGTSALRNDATILAFDATLPAAEAFSSVGTQGSASVAARRDHTHPMPASPVTSINASGNSALTGAVNLVAGSNITLAQSGQGITITGTAGSAASSGVPALTFGTTNVAGTGGTFVDAGATVLLYDGTMPSTQAFGDAAATGTATTAPRRDHKHAMPADPAPPSWTWFPWAGYSVAAGSWARTLSANYFCQVLWYNTSNAQNDALSVPFRVAAGTYTIYYIYHQGPDRAIATFNVDGSPVGTIDQYAGGAAQNAVGTITGVAIAAGAHTLQLIAATRNASGSGWYMDHVSVMFVRTGA